MILDVILRFIYSSWLYDDFIKIVITVNHTDTIFYNHYSVANFFLSLFNNLKKKTLLHFEILIVRFSLKLMSFTIAENSKKALIILGLILFYNDLETNINDAKYIRYITSVLYTCGFLTVGRIIELLSYSWIRMN